MRRILPLLVCVGAASAGRGQSGAGYDARDVVTLVNGKEVRGRVLSRYGLERIVLVQGGKRLRFARKDVRSVHTIHDDIARFFAYREAVGTSAKRRWILVEWAASKKLAALARLQALSIVLADPKAEQAHRFLGHRQRGGEWLWPFRDRFRPLAALEEYHRKWGTALQLTGEHFKVKTDAGLARAVSMLLDLERLYLFWEQTFGEALGMRAALQPIAVHAWASAADFPKISALELAYYSLRDDAAITYFRPDAQRPEQLLAVATQALIYGTLVTARPQYERNHLCAWLEVGLGQWVERAFGGKPGAAAPRAKIELDTTLASTVVRTNPALNRVIHLNYELYYELSDRVALRWMATEAFVHYLMSVDPDPSVRHRFMKYLVRVFRHGLGDSSTAFDRTMGEKIETLQPRFRRWLQARK